MTKLKKRLIRVEHTNFGEGTKQTKFTPFFQFVQEA
jgi:hypothetical protein